MSSLNITSQLCSAILKPVVVEYPESYGAQFPVAGEKIIAMCPEIPVGAVDAAEVHNMRVIAFCLEITHLFDEIV